MCANAKVGSKIFDKVKWCIFFETFIVNHVSPYLPPDFISFYSLQCAFVLRQFTVRFFHFLSESLYLYATLNSRYLISLLDVEREWSNNKNSNNIRHKKKTRIEIRWKLITKERKLERMCSVRFPMITPKCERKKIYFIPFECTNTSW